MHSQVVALSIAAANKLIGETLDEQQQRRRPTGTVASVIGLIDQVDLDDCEIKR